MQDPVLLGDAEQGVQKEDSGILPSQRLLFQRVLVLSLLGSGHRQCFTLLKVLGNGQPVFQCSAWA